MKTLQIETVTLHDDSRMDVIRDIAAVRKDPRTGHWVAVLDAADAPVETRMGQRILDYWRAAK